MANTPVDPGAMSLPLLYFLDASNAVLDSVPCLSVPDREFKRNRQAFQAYENDNANASGDGRLLTGERSIDVLIQVTAAKPATQRLAEVEAVLEACAKLKLDTITISIQGSTGVQTSRSLTNLDTGDLVATLGYIPATPAGNDGTHDHLGPL